MPAIAGGAPAWQVAIGRAARISTGTSDIHRNECALREWRRAPSAFAALRASVPARRPWPRQSTGRAALTGPAPSSTGPGWQYGEVPRQPRGELVAGRVPGRRAYGARTTSMLSTSALAQGKPDTLAFGESFSWEAVTQNLFG